jgi:hypothetical protein
MWRSAGGICARCPEGDNSIVSKSALEPVINYLMLKAYLDASGTDPTKDIIVVGGWVASEDRWAEFVPQWRTFLVDCFGPNGGRWHNTDFHSGHRQYKVWDDQKRDRARMELCRIIGGLKPIGIGAAVRKSDYNELWQTGRWQLSDRWSTGGDPYGLYMDECLEVLTHRIDQLPRDEGVQIIVDSDEKKGLSRRISDWHKNYLSSNEQARNRGRRVEFDHGSDQDHLPLQAADVLVNETYRYMRNKYRTAETAKTLVPFLGASPMGTTDKDARHIIEALKPNCMFIVPLYNKGALEIILDGKASGAIRPDGFNAEAIPGAGC